MAQKKECVKSVVKLYSLEERRVCFVMARIRELYKEKIVAALTEKFGYKNFFEVPKLFKIVVSVATDEVKDNSKVITFISGDIAKITGQQPVVCKAKKSVANFKIREGMNIGVKVTLRGNKMYEFLDRLFSFALPRVRDFRGINPSSFDGRGNYNLGIKEQLIFPEIEYDKIDKIRGMDICIVTTAKTDDEAKALLELCGAPFKKQ